MTLGKVLQRRPKKASALDVRLPARQWGERCFDKEFREGAILIPDVAPIAHSRNAAAVSQEQRANASYIHQRLIRNGAM
jgi:hypothetical protein